MLENCQSAQERWGGVSEIIDRWLNERKHLLVEFCALTETVEDLDHNSCGLRVQTLCQLLVDYVSAGHFEVYGQLVEEGRELGDEQGLKKAGELFKLIDDTTENLLDFNDKYQEIDDLDAIELDLSKIGEWLAVRFEAEDKMIEVLHFAHQDRIAQGA